MTPRADIQMTDDEVTAFLERQHRAVVAFEGADGWPHAIVAPASFRGRSVTVESELGSARVCCIAEESPTYYEIRGVIAFGTATASSPTTTEIALDRMRTFDFGKLPEAE